jgi:hypothetical protein
VFVKEHNVLHKNRKLAETSKGLFRIPNIHENVMALIRGKNSIHDNLVNTDLLVKYNRPKNTDETQTPKNVEPEPEIKGNSTNPERQYNKRIFV